VLAFDFFEALDPDFSGMYFPEQDAADFHSAPRQRDKPFDRQASKILNHRRADGNTPFFHRKFPIAKWHFPN
jgi:hypothetical protein